jgi:hypothetical protein
VIERLGVNLLYKEKLPVTILFEKHRFAVFQSFLFAFLWILAICQIQQVSSKRKSVKVV